MGLPGRVCRGGFSEWCLAINGCRETRPYVGGNAMGVGMRAIAPKHTGDRNVGAGFAATFARPDNPKCKPAPAHNARPPILVVKW